MDTNFITNCRKASLVYRAINHKLRRQILEQLQPGPKTVTEIYVGLRLEQSVASQHLGILRKAKLVATARTGKHINYSIDPDGFKALTAANGALGYN